MKYQKIFTSNLYKQMQDGEVGLVAASLAFTTALAFIPFVTVCLVALQKFGVVESLYPKIESFVLSNFSDAAGTQGIKLVKTSISRVASGKLGTIGTLLLLITSTRLIYVLERAVNRVWNIKNSRSIYKRLLAYWAVLLLIPVSLAGSFAVFSTQKNISPLFLKIVLFLIPLYLINAYVPATKVKKKFALLGASVSTFLVIFFQSFFFNINIKVFIYSKLYGSLASVPLFLIWILTMWYLVLIGVAITASFQRENHVI